MEDNLPSNVRDLLARHLASMDHVAVLLLLRRVAPLGHTPASMSDELRMDARVVSRVLRDLIASKLVRNEGRAHDGAFVFSPPSDAMRKAVEGLEEAYNCRPVTLIRAVYEGPSRLSRSFADGFGRQADSEDDD